MPYDSRIRELNDRYAALLGKITAEEASRIKTAIDAYASVRNNLLPSLILQATSTGDQPIGDSWGPKLQESRKGLDEILKTMLDSVRNPSSEALAFQGQARVEDDFFFGGLAGVALDAARDGILAISANLFTYIAILDAKWSTLTERDKEIEQLEEQLMRELNEATRASIDEGNKAIERFAPKVTETIQDVLESYRLVTKNAKIEWTEYLKTLGDHSTISDMNAETWATFLSTVLDPGKWVQSLIMPKLDSNLQSILDLLAGQIKAGLPLVNGFFAERVGKLRNLVPVQGTILVVFSETRKDADEFVRNHGLDSAKAIYDRASSSLDSWASSQSGANSGDASAIKTEIVALLRDRIDKLANAFNEFVRNYNGKFFSSVSSEVERQFINSEFWDESRRNAEAWNLEARLRFYSDNLVRFVPDMQNAFARFGDSVSELPIQIQDAFRTKVQDAQARFLDAVSSKLEQAKSAVENAKSAARTDDVTQAIDRGPLKSLLR